MAILTSLESGLSAGVRGRHPALRWISRAIDVCGAVMGFALFWWLFGLIALVIRLDSRGPVLFRQVRLGKDREPFVIYKFRTMRDDGDECVRHPEHRQGLLFKDADDPRFTRLGRWLRRTSLDELPQLYNILRGEMALVGPRPLPVSDTQYYRDWQWERLTVLPGLTGLWQVSGRSRLNSEQMVLLDLYYIRNWSLSLDFVILLRTIWVVLTRDGAC